MLPSRRVLLASVVVAVVMTAFEAYLFRTQSTAQAPRAATAPTPLPLAATAPRNDATLISLLRQAMTMPDDALRRERLRAIADGLTEAQLLALLDAPELSREFPEFLELACVRLGELHPAAFAARIAAAPASEERDQLLGWLCEGWGRTDPRAALSWIQHAITRPARDPFLCELAVKVAEAGDPRAAFDVVRTLPAPNHDRDAALLRVLEAQGATDPAAALALLAALGRDDPAYALAIMGASRAIAKQNTQQALDLVMEHMPEGDMKGSSILTVLENSLMEQPAVYAPWVLENLGPEIQSNALDRVIPKWMTRDAAACAAWMTTHCPESIRNSVAFSALMSNPDLPEADAGRLMPLLTDEQKSILQKNRRPAVVDPGL